MQKQQKTRAQIEKDWKYHKYGLMMQPIKLIMRQLHIPNMRNGANTTNSARCNQRIKQFQQWQWNMTNTHIWRIPQF